MVGVIRIKGSQTPGNDIVQFVILIPKRAVCTLRLQAQTSMVSSKKGMTEDIPV